MDTDEIWLRLAQVRGLNRHRLMAIAHALEQEGGASAALTYSGLTSVQRTQFMAARGITASLAWRDRGQGSLLTLANDVYPAYLRQIVGAPPILFIRGDPTRLFPTALAIVGSRTPSIYGEAQAQFFSRMLAAAGVTIVSGLALGIDAMAHRGALATQGNTVAVLGSGLDRITPQANQGLSEAILEAGGVLLSEFPPGCGARPSHFPRRNRIISGLSLGVLVVEATFRSGSLITARLALEQGREVFAIPGPLHSMQSAGCHWLIQQGAFLSTTPAEIMEQLDGPLRWVAPVTEGNISAGKADAQLPFAEVLANVGDEVTTVDAVAERIGRSVPEVAVELLELELAGWIKAVSGGYVRVKRAGHVRCTHVSV